MSIVSNSSLDSLCGVFSSVFVLSRMDFWRTFGRPDSSFPRLLVSIHSIAYLELRRCNVSAVAVWSSSRWLTRQLSFLYSCCAVAGLMRLTIHVIDMLAMIIRLPTEIMMESPRMLKDAQSFRRMICASHIHMSVSGGGVIMLSSETSCHPVTKLVMYACIVKS